MNRSKGKERWIHDYKSTQKILLVGEGDFSFSACLARAFHTAENIVATSYLRRKSLLKKHPTSILHLDELESLGCKLFYKVDVYKMLTHPTLKNMKFDIIIFNFPHAGHYDYLCERDPQLIAMHMELVEAYFYSARKMLTKCGEVHLRHREDSPYDSWNVVLLAGNAGLTLKEKVVFYKSDYPGYQNKRRGGINTDNSFRILWAYTYKFVLDSPKIVDYHCYDFYKKDEVNVLEMDNQVYHDAVYDIANELKIKEGILVEQDLKRYEVNTKFQIDEVDDIFAQKRDEVRLLLNGGADVDLPNSDVVVVDDLDLHAPEMVGLLKKSDDEVHVVNSDLDLQKVVDHHFSMNIETQKLDKKHLRNDDDHDGVKDAYLSKNDHGVNLDVCVEEMKDNEVDDDHDVYVKEMKDKMERLHGDLYARVLEMMDQLEYITLVNTIYA